MLLKITRDDDLESIFRQPIMTKNMTRNSLQTEQLIWICKLPDMT